jgi:hypothetical protein
MEDSSVALTEQLLQETIPRKARCGGKALTLLFLLIGFKLTVLLSQMTWSSGNDEQRLALNDPSNALNEPSIAMALQPTRALRLPQFGKALPVPQAARARLFTSQSMQPVARGFPYSTQITAVKDQAAAATSGDPSPQDDGTGALAVLKKKFGPLGDLMKKYGALALGFHFTVWTLTLGTSFTVLSIGLGVESYLPAGIVAMLPAGTGNLAAAYILTEATGPLRTLFTLGIVPILGEKFLPAEGEQEGPESESARQPES